ncbi:alpha-amylase [Streptomyces marokkonensis]|uniref:Alpha-amylase inhibitor n=1 Tax=Streptomyces marokkonensis TaxID=324855 RepID=A0ABW6Q4K3_9ACTN
MKRLACSTFVAVVMAALAVVVPGASAHAGSQEAAGSRLAAPGCVRFSPGWRYTFVTNDCSVTHTVTVVYRDGTDVPCRVAPPGAMITFPGYGTLGNEVLGVILCDTGEGTPGGP